MGWLREEIGRIVSQAGLNLTPAMQETLTQDLHEAASDYIETHGASLLEELGGPLRQKPNLNQAQRELIRTDVASAIIKMLMGYCPNAGQGHKLPD